MAAMLALAGAGLLLPTAAGAAVFKPADGAMRDEAGTGIILVQRGNRQFRAAPTVRRAPALVRPNRISRPSIGTRAVRPGNFARPSRGIRPGVVGRGSIGRPARISRPGVVVHRRGFRPAGFRRWHPRHLIVRPWYRRPYYGTIIGGIAIGTILAASAYYAYAAEPPAPGLCWYWVDEDETQGYWDYCVDPQ